MAYFPTPETGGTWVEVAAGSMFDFPPSIGDQVAGTWLLEQFGTVARLTLDCEWFSGVLGVIDTFVEGFIPVNYRPPLNVDVRRMDPAGHVSVIGAIGSEGRVDLYRDDPLGPFPFVYVVCWEIG